MSLNLSGSWNQKRVYVVISFFVPHNLISDFPFSVAFKSWFGDKSELVWWSSLPVQTDPSCIRRYFPKQTWFTTRSQGQSWAVSCSVAIHPAAGVPESRVNHEQSHQMQIISNCNLHGLGKEGAWPNPVAGVSQCQAFSCPSNEMISAPSGVGCFQRGTSTDTWYYSSLWLSLSLIV